MDDQTQTCTATTTDSDGQARVCRVAVPHDGGMHRDGNLSWRQVPANTWRDGPYPRGLDGVPVGAVRELRARTGLPVMECVRVLQRFGDVDRAAEVLGEWPRARA